MNHVCSAHTRRMVKSCCFFALIVTGNGAANLFNCEEKGPRLQKRKSIISVFQENPSLFSSISLHSLLSCLSLLLKFEISKPMATSSSSNIPSPKFPSSSSAKTDAETLRRNRILSSKLYFHVPPSKVSLFILTSHM